MPEIATLNTKRLFAAVSASYQQLKWARELNAKLIKHYLGPEYGKRGGAKKLANKVFQFVDTYTMLLAANGPAATIDSHYPELRAFSRHYQVGLNNLMREIDVEHTTQQFVQDALFLMGIVRLHMADAGYVVWEGDVGMDPGTPFLSNIFLDDWVHDMSARQYGQVRFSGNMYQLPHRRLVEGAEMGIYAPEVVEETKPSSKFMSDDSDRVEKIARGIAVDDDDLEPMVNLADIWLPDRQQIKTYAVADRTCFRLKGEDLASLDWTEPETGPYITLGFGNAPQSVVPISPITQLYAIEEVINLLSRKSAKQAGSQKENLCYEPGGDIAAKALASSSDGELIGVTGLDRTKVVRQGGIDHATVQYTGMLMELFDELAGGLKILAGTGAESDTVGQERLIHSASGRRVASMQHAVLGAMRKIVTGLASLLWQDNYKVVPASLPIPGLEGESVDATWMPEDREGEFNEYQYDVNIYRQPQRTPAERANSIVMLLRDVIVPLTGTSVNMDALVGILAELTDEPKLREIVPNQGTYDDSKPSPTEARKPPSTSRSYTQRRAPAGQNGWQIQGPQLAPGIQETSHVA